MMPGGRWFWAVMPIAFVAAIGYALWQGQVAAQEPGWKVRNAQQLPGDVHVFTMMRGTSCFVVVRAERLEKTIMGREANHPAITISVTPAHYSICD